MREPFMLPPNPAEVRRNMAADARTAANECRTAAEWYFAVGRREEGGRQHVIARQYDAEATKLETAKD